MKEAKSESQFAFRLLVPAAQKKDGPSIELCGSRWVLVDFAEMSDAPPYTCVSYSWGIGRRENVLEGGQLMSDRAIPATKAAIIASRNIFTNFDAPQAIWIDSLCMPQEESVRRDCLSSMGVIFGCASQVIVVLASSCAESLRKASNGEQMGDEELLALENDTWITRAWTYQEAANAKKILFVAEGDGKVAVEAEDLLNKIMNDGACRQGTPGVWGLELSIKYPWLSRLQDTIAEWKISDLYDRPVFHIMVAIGTRRSEIEEDRIYPMIGALRDGAIGRLHKSALSPVEFFMQECETIGDYSFIFCKEPRSEAPGKRWRPVGNKLTALVSNTLSVGRGLSGRQEKNCLRLNNVCLMKALDVNGDSINETLNTPENNKLTHNSLAQIRERLVAMEYYGGGDVIETDSGYFFPQSKILPAGDFTVVASKEVLWDGGGPALLVRSRGESIFEFCDVGVFFGRLQEGGVSIEII